MRSSLKQRYVTYYNSNGTLIKKIIKQGIKIKSFWVGDPVPYETEEDPYADPEYKKVNDNSKKNNIRYKRNP